jgi:hypothetical protein
MTLSAGSTPPFAVTAPDVNQPANSTAETLHVTLASAGRTVCAFASWLEITSTEVATTYRGFLNA